jgi:hypothetical protein
MIINGISLGPSKLKINLFHRNALWVVHLAFEPIRKD